MNERDGKTQFVYKKDQIFSLSTGVSEKHNDVEPGEEVWSINDEPRVWV